MSAVARPAVETLVSVLKRRATEQPDRLAYVFVSEGAGEDRLTYGELDRKAKAIAHSLQGVAARGDCALLLYPAGLDFLAAFLGCLHAGVIAIPLFAPRPNREDPRLNAIIADSGARLALTVSNALPDRSSRGSRWTRLEYMFTDRIDSALGDHWRDSSVSKDELAYLQYTSGSTSDPKGVMVTHDNLLYNCSLMQECLGLSENTVSVTWLPHFHDMGLIDGLLNPLHVGYPAIVMSPTQFVARPVRWLRLISRFKATHSGGPNFAYDLCAKKIGVEERSELDLSSWTMAYSGSEPVRSETLDRFADYFAPCGFRRQSLYPSYGLAEATLMVSGGRHSTGPSVKDVDVAHLERGVYHAANGGKSRRLVACGVSSARNRTGDCRPATLTVCEDGKVGEIWFQVRHELAGIGSSPRSPAKPSRLLSRIRKRARFCERATSGFCTAMSCLLPVA
jgi:acyl-CoA synthetase (AMP-forming)/AMP-acid ligase II